MSSPDERPSGSARSDATKVVEEALRSGRIVQADHDMRIDQIRRAQTVQEIDLQVRDLQSRPVAAAAATSASPLSTGSSGAAGTPGSATQPPPVSAQGSQPWPLVNYGPSPGDIAVFTQTANAVTKGTGRAIGGIIAVVVVMALVVPIVGVVIAFLASRDSFPSFEDAGPTDESTYLPGQAPGSDGVNVHTVEGFEALVDAVQDEFGTTIVFNASLYPRYAVVDVPTGVNNRYEAWYWDGRTLEQNTSRGTSTGQTIDLALVDPAQIVRMLETVRERIEDPTSWYASVSHWSGPEAQVYASASNSYGENVSLIETLDGTVVYDSTQQ